MSQGLKVADTGVRAGEAMKNGAEDRDALGAAGGWPFSMAARSFGSAAQDRPSERGSHLPWHIVADKCNGTRVRREDGRRGTGSEARRCRRVMVHNNRGPLAGLSVSRPMGPWC